MHQYFVNPLSRNVPQCAQLGFFNCLTPDDFTCEALQLNGLTKKSLRLCSLMVKSRV
jgi:hypothetical protein